MERGPSGTLHLRRSRSTRSTKSACQQEPRPTWIASSNSMRPHERRRSGRRTQRTPLCSSHTKSPWRARISPPQRRSVPRRPTGGPNPSHAACQAYTTLTTMTAYKVYPRHVLICLCADPSSGENCACVRPISSTITTRRSSASPCRGVGWAPKRASTCSHSCPARSTSSPSAAGPRPDDIVGL